MKNPLINALLAAGYIVAIVSFMTFGLKFEGPDNEFLIPIAMLSLFVLSVAVMGFLFVAQPILIAVEGDKKGAVRLFLQTLGIFAALTVVAFTLLFVFR